MYREGDWELLFNALEKTKKPMEGDFTIASPGGAAGYLGSGEIYARDEAMLAETTVPPMSEDK